MDQAFPIYFNLYTILQGWFYYSQLTKWENWRFKVVKELDFISKLKNSKNHLPTFLTSFFSHLKKKKDPRIPLPALIPLFLILSQVTTIVVVFLPSFLFLDLFNFPKITLPTYFLMSLIPTLLPNLVWLKPCSQHQSSYQIDLDYGTIIIMTANSYWALFYVLDTSWDKYHHYPHFRDVKTELPKS